MKDIKVLGVDLADEMINSVLLGDSKKNCPG